MTDDYIHRSFELGEHVITVTNWPRWLRRLFVLTSPVSWVVWLGLLFAVWIGCFALALAWMIADGLTMLWTKP